MTEQISIPEMTWTEVDEVLKEHPTVAIVPIGTTEAHGPHLPLSSECIIAVDLAKRGAAKLKEHGVSSLVLPTVTYGVNERALGFAGTIGITPETLTALLRDIAVSATKRFRSVAFISLHLEAKHVGAIKKAVEEATAAGSRVCYVDVTRKRWADSLGETFTPLEHAGSMESSLLIAASPDSVRERERISLPPEEEATKALEKGQTLLEAGAEDAYTGDPTAASQEDGENLLDAIAEIASLSIMEHLGKT
jgi:creatinine amidohydrolase